MSDSSGFVPPAGQPAPPSAPSAPAQALPVAWPVGPTKPGLVSAIGALRLASGCVNIIFGIFGSLAYLSTVFLIPMCCLCVLLIPLGVVEIINGTELLSRRGAKPGGLKTLAILEILAILVCNPVSAVIGILTLVFLDDEAVRNYFACLGYPC